jgi:Domain of unknown function (DUF4296)
MKKKLYYLLVVLSFSCKKNHIISLPTMATIMVDMHLADAYAGLIYQQDTAHVTNTINKDLDTLKTYYAKVFKQYHISEQTYVTQLKKYQQDAILWDSLYVLVQQKLSTRRPKDLH